LIAAVLSNTGRGSKSLGNGNNPRYFAPVILNVRPRDSFCVIEMGVGKYGQEHVFEQSLKLVRPRIAVVTNVGGDHIRAFGSLEAIARQKGRLVESVPRDGTAILNADDPNVIAMRHRCAGRVITYGQSAEAILRAEEVSASWPDRLAFTMAYNGRRHRVQTQLCGRHWVQSVLAAVATGITLGVEVQDAIRSIEGISPFPSRMSPEVRADGVAFIRDDFKNPLWSIPAALAFMREARAERKVVVVGSISDYSGEDATAVSVALQALAVADYVVFIGPKAYKCMKERTRSYGTRLQAFLSLDHAASALRELLRSGDLVLLKGTDKDKFDELLSACLRPIPHRVPSASPVAAAESDAAVTPLVNQAASCESPVSGQRVEEGGSDCRPGILQRLEVERKALRSRMHGLYTRRNALSKEIGAAKRLGAEDASALKAEAREISRELERLEGALEEIQRQLDGPLAAHNHADGTAWVVGLGNPTEEAINTPHNIGQAVVDFLAEEMAAKWVQEDLAFVSTVEWEGRTLLLVKPVTPVNHSGPIILQLARRLQLSPHYGVLVQDDVSLALGTVRTRTKGTDGGHRGVRSILQAFETDAFARVKVGVATPERLQQSMQGVLAPFTSDEIAVVRTAYPLAAHKIFELMRVARTRDRARLFV
jgi:aminoacyl-tRNA hydrolase